MPTADSESSVWGRKQTSLNRVLHVSFSARRLTGPWSPIADDSGVPPPQLYWRMTDTWDCADEAIFLGKFGNMFGELLKQVYQAQADAGWKSSVVISELGEKREVTAMPGFSVDSSKARQQGLDRQRCEAQKWLQRTTKEDNRYMTIPEGRGRGQGRRWRQLHGFGVFKGTRPWLAWLLVGGLSGCFPPSLSPPSFPFL